MTTDQGRCERLQKLSDRLATYAKAIAAKHEELALLHDVLGEDLAELGRDLAQLDIEGGVQEAEASVLADPAPVSHDGTPAETAEPAHGRRPRAWTPAEEDLVRQRYPSGGAAAAHAALAAAGYDRTIAAITYRAHVLGVRARAVRPSEAGEQQVARHEDPEPEPPPEPQVEPRPSAPDPDLPRAQRRILDALRAFPGRSLTIAEIGAAAGLSERAALLWIGGLTKKGLVATGDTGGETVYSDPRAEQKAA